MHLPGRASRCVEVEKCLLQIPLYLVGVVRPRRRNIANVIRIDQFFFPNPALFLFDGTLDGNVVRGLKGHLEGRKPKEKVEMLGTRKSWP